LGLSESANPLRYNIGLSFDSVLARAGEWFVCSGIQESSGGVARYYRTDQARNHPVSTEITGYAVSAFLFFEQPDKALEAARFLARRAWNGHSMPFEINHGPNGLATYFFDCGIIVRGLLAAWRATGEKEFLGVAAALGRTMAADFASADGDYHPILKLPEKKPVPRDPLRWSQEAGCYQLKSALAWWELFEVTGEGIFSESYERLLENALRGYPRFLPGHSDPLKVVDRLHAFLYFLEGMLPKAGEPAGSPATAERCRAALCDGIRRVASHLDQAASEFERSDVYAQLLRIRVFADWMGIVPVDEVAAQRESAILAGFQAAGDDPRIDGGFYFGRKNGTWLPYVNPVSTAFAAQALALWQRHRHGKAPADWLQLI
jgi:hypothetical protein